MTAPTASRAIRAAGTALLLGASLSVAMLMLDEFATISLGRLRIGTTAPLLLAVSALVAAFRGPGPAIAVGATLVGLLLLLGAVEYVRTTDHPLWQMMAAWSILAAGFGSLSAASAAVGAMVAAPGRSERAIGATVVAGLYAGFLGSGTAVPMLSPYGFTARTIVPPILGFAIALLLLRRPVRTPAATTTPATFAEASWFDGRRFVRAFALGALVPAVLALALTLLDVGPRLASPETDPAARARALRSVAGWTGIGALVGAVATLPSAALAVRGWPARIIARNALLGLLLGTFAGMLAAGPFFHGPEYSIPRELGGAIIGVLLAALRMRRPYRGSAAARVPTEGA